MKQEASSPELRFGALVLPPGLFDKAGSRALLAQVGYYTFCATAAAQTSS